MTVVWSPKQILMDMCTHEESDLSSKLTMVIWLKRNNWTWNQEKLVATQVSMLAASLRADWL